ncbi:MAG: hypothetical protein ACHQET_04130 [Chitinophagales bacterium]
MKKYLFGVIVLLLVSGFAMASGQGRNHSVNHHPVKHHPRHHHQHPHHPHR